MTLFTIGLSGEETKERFSFFLRLSVGKANAKVIRELLVKKLGKIHRLFGQFP
jgi:hypothetical protein